MKHLLAVGVVLCALANEAAAQGSEVHMRYGPSGSHVTLSPGTPFFHYEATVTGSTAPYTVQLEVYHNSALKSSSLTLVPVPTMPYQYVSPVDMQDWGLSTGDTVTFVLRVIDTATGVTLATHCLHGDVAGT